MTTIQYPDVKQVVYGGEDFFFDASYDDLEVFARSCGVDIPDLQMDDAEIIFDR